MFRPFSLYVGLRNFTSGSSNRLVSFISLLAILGLVLGVALLIVVSSIMNGFDHEMESRILGAIPHVRLFKEGGVDDVSSLITELETQENVRAAMPFAQVEGMLTSRGKTRPVEMLGVDGALSGEFIGQFVSPELFTSFQGDERMVLLAKGVAEKLMASVEIPSISGISHTILVPFSILGRILMALE